MIDIAPSVEPERETARDTHRERATKRLSGRESRDWGVPCRMPVL